MLRNVLTNTLPFNILMLFYNFSLHRGTLLLSKSAASSPWTDLPDVKDDDEALSHRFEGIGRFYAGIDDDWIVYSSVLWSNGKMTLLLG